MYTAYPAALRASDGSTLWEGAEAESGSLALAGDGIYTVEPVKRLYPSPGPTTLEAVLGRTTFHSFDGGGLGWQDVDSAEIQKLRPKDSWEEHGVRTDPTGRWWLFYERQLSKKPGQRELVPGEWQFMMYDSKSGSVSYTRTIASVGWTPLTSDSTPGDTSSDGDRVLVLSDGRFVAGDRLAGQDEAEDVTLVEGVAARVRGLQPIEGSATLIWVGLEYDSSLSQEQLQGAPDGFYFDVSGRRKDYLPKGYYAISASRDGRKVVVASSGDVPVGLGLWDLP